MGELMESDDFTRAFLIPAASSLFTGLLVTLLGLAICGCVHQPASYGLAAGGLAALLSWLAFRAHWAQLVQAVLLPDQVQPVDRETDQVQPVRVQLVQEIDGYQQGQFVDLPATVEQLSSLAQGLARGAPLSLAAWTGQGQAFSRHEFETLRLELLTRGLARWTSSRARAQGLELTPAGRAVFKRLASTPLPGDVDQE